MMVSPSVVMVPAVSRKRRWMAAYRKDGPRRQRGTPILAAKSKRARLESQSAMHL